MEQLKLIVPSLDYKEKAIDYINEFIEYNSEINGSGGLHRYLDNYEGWLLKLDDDRKCIANAQRVPADTFFLVREEDDKILGMINIRYVLNENLKDFGGNIGYAIRPTERKKGYNKVNLYLGLLKCQEHGVKEVLLDCDKENLGSSKTMQALGGKLVRERYIKNAYCDGIVQDYVIDVDKAIEEHKNIYESSFSK